MKRIIIFGDSWSQVPGNIDNFEYKKRLGEWLDFRLMARGHSVYNIGKNANDNRNQLNYVEQILQGIYYQNLKVDLIVWFHTESLRNITNKGLWENPNHKEYAHQTTNLMSVGLDSYVDQLSEQDYKSATMIKNKYPDIQWAIIGGHAPIRTSKKHMLDWADLLIENWRYDITGQDCPDCQCYTLIRYSGFEQMAHLLSKDVVQRELDYSKQLNNACSDPTLFYDGVHPNVNPNIKLSELLFREFNL